MVDSPQLTKLQERIKHSTICVSGVYGAISYHDKRKKVVDIANILKNIKNMKVQGDFDLPTMEEITELQKDIINVETRSKGQLLKAMGYSNIGQYKEFNPLSGMSSNKRTLIKMYRSGHNIHQSLGALSIKMNSLTPMEVDEYIKELGGTNNAETE